MRHAALLMVVLLAAGGCRKTPDAVPADAAAEAQARTSAKAEADIAAAEEAARTPLPAGARRESPGAKEPGASDAEPGEDVGPTERPVNETTDR